MALNTSVMGIYPDHTTVSDSVGTLRKAGYRATDVSVLSSENQGTKDFGIEQRARALEVAAMAAAPSAVFGAALAWFVSMQTVTVPGLGLVVAAGPVMAVLAGAGVGGAIGWLAGMVAGSGMSEYVAKRYIGRVRRGGILLSVHCDSQEWCDRAKQILKDTGARNISSKSETAADYGATDRPTERSPIIVVPPVDNPIEQPSEYSSKETRP